MKNNYYYRSGMHRMLTDKLLERVQRKFHYEEQHMPALKMIAKDIYSCIKDQESIEMILNHDEIIGLCAVDVVISMGSNLDMLIEKYSMKNKIMEELMVDNIISELFIDAYNEAVRLACEVSDMNVSELHFWGDSDAYPIEGMEAVVEKVETTKISIMPNGNLRPGKSVVFRLIMTDEAEPFVLNLCGECELGKSGQCDYGR